MGKLWLQLQYVTNLLFQLIELIFKVREVSNIC